MAAAMPKEQEVVPPVAERHGMDFHHGPKVGHFEAMDGESDTRGNRAPAPPATGLVSVPRKVEQRQKGGK